jgi:dephospho-CoA kinase
MKRVLLTGMSGTGKSTVINELGARGYKADDADALFLSGCSPNQGKFYPQFDHIVLLTAPAAVIVERLATRTTNPYGKHPDEVARVLYLQQTVEPLLRRGVGLKVDTTAPLDQVVATVLGHVTMP